jgi:hypothetical protein
MMPRTLIIVIGLIVAWLGPALDDRSAEADQVAAIDDARQQAAQQARYNAAVQSMCGPNAAWMELADGEIQCTNKRGTPTTRVTITARLAP